MRITTARSTLPHISLPLACLALLGCDGSPGSSQIRTFDAEDGSLIWERTLPTEGFAAYAADAPDAIIVQGYDSCYGAAFKHVVDRRSGDTLQSLPEMSSAQSGGPAADYVASACAGRGGRRVELTSGRRVDVCTGEASVRAVDTANGGELLNLSTDPIIEHQVVGDTLLIVQSYSRRVDLYALDTGEQLWTWRAPGEAIQLLGVDDEHVYAWDPSTSDTLALSLEDGEPAWRSNLACEELRYLDGLLVCANTLRDSTCAASD